MLKLAVERKPRDGFYVTFLDRKVVELAEMDFLLNAYCTLDPVMLHVRWSFATLFTLSLCLFLSIYHFLQKNGACWRSGILFHCWIMWSNVITIFSELNGLLRKFRTAESLWHCTILSGNFLLWYLTFAGNWSPQSILIHSFKVFKVRTLISFSFLFLFRWGFLNI